MRGVNSNKALAVAIVASLGAVVLGWCLAPWVES